MFRDVLLYIMTYPVPLPRSSIKAATDVAAVLDAHLTGLVMKPDIPQPVSFRTLPQGLLDQMTAERQKMDTDAIDQIAAFEKEAGSSGVASEGLSVSCAAADTGRLLSEYARTRDLTIVPFVAKDDGWKSIAQAVIFDSGRPVLVLPAEPRKPFQLDEIVVAWDSSRAASRAIADAMPLLRQAGNVHLVIVTNDKTLASQSGPEIARHLECNDVNFKIEEIDRARKSVGDTLLDAAREADLLVMGAFGHSRLREFFLGSATQSVLAGSPLPVLMSN